MTTIDEARRRSTDQTLADAMTEAGNGDPKRIGASGKALHYDAFSGMDAHRELQRPSNADGAWAVGKAAVGKAGSAAIDALVDRGVGALATFGGRAALGAAWQVLGTATLAYELYTEGFVKPNCEKDKQLSLAASDAGVVGLAQVLPFDADFKTAVTRAHGGSSSAAASMAATLMKPEHRTELTELSFRSEKGLLDAAPLARSAAHDIASCMRGAKDALGHAKEARARGDGVAAENFEERAREAVAHAAALEKSALATIFARAKTDAAYGLGVQCAMHHALRVEMGLEEPGAFAALLARARADVTALDPSTLTVRG